MVERDIAGGSDLLQKTFVASLYVLKFGVRISVLAARTANIWFENRDSSDNRTCRDWWLSRKKVRVVFLVTKSSNKNLTILYYAFRIYFTL